MSLGLNELTRKGCKWTTYAFQPHFHWPINISMQRHNSFLCALHTIPTPGSVSSHDDVIKWKHFPRNWPFVRGIHRSPVNSPHKGQWRGALMFTLICARINVWVNTREAGDLRRYCPHYDVIVMRGIVSGTLCQDGPGQTNLIISCLSSPQGGVNGCYEDGPQTAQWNLI